MQTDFIGDFVEEIKSKNIDAKTNVSLKALTSFNIGGNADVLLSPCNLTQLKEIITSCKVFDTPLFVMGNGTNLLISDKGIRGAVVSLPSNFAGIKLQNETDIICGAGIKLSTLAAFAEKNALTGLEFAHGIPGTAGGAAYMNAGAYGGEMKDVIVSCTHMDTNGNEATLSLDSLKFGYRTSVYKSNNCIITSITLRLQKGDRNNISQKMAELMQKRKSKQPLEFPSAGSVFKRPEGNFAGTLIEKCGLKGYSIGGAQVSEKHAGFIINTGNATCKDVLLLIEHIKNEVFEKTGITLQCEIKMIGE